MHTASLVVTGYRPVGEIDGTRAATPNQSEDTLQQGQNSDVEMSNLNPRHDGLVKRGAKGTNASSEVEQQTTKMGDVGPRKPAMKEVAISVVEQRVSNLAQGMLGE